MAGRKHTLLSPSSSSRWLNCTASPHFEEQFPSEVSTYAEEGTLAHKLCEEIVNYNNHVTTKRTFNAHLKKIQADPLYQDEMLKTAGFYQHYIFEKSMTFESKPLMVVEDKVQLDAWIPDGFGTCDCVMIGSGRLHITDYKHGKGVEVSAQNNSQMRLYALGALKKYMPIYGDSIKIVSMAIVQPRITEEVSEEEISVQDLLAWGENIKPIAQKAYGPDGEFKAGTWCKFCKGRSVCRARAENATAFEEFKDVPIEGQLTAAEKAARDTQKVITGDVPKMLTDEEVGDLLTRAAVLVAWYSDLQDYALQAIQNGHTIPGYKVVAGRSNRAFTDADAAMQTILAAGYDEALLYERKAKSLAELEKMIGKAEFAEMVGSFITKPIGKPTLTTSDDKRPDYNDALRDFENVGKTEG